MITLFGAHFHSAKDRQGRKKMSWILVQSGRLQTLQSYFSGFSVWDEWITCLHIQSIDASFKKKPKKKNNSEEKGNLQLLGEKSQAVQHVDFTQTYSAVVIVMNACHIIAYWFCNNANQDQLLQLICFSEALEIKPWLTNQWFFLL